MQSNHRATNNRDLRYIERISNAFLSNARMQALSSKQGKLLKRDVRKIIRYAYDAVKKCNGIIHDKAGHSFLLYYQKRRFYLSPRDMWRYALIAWSVVGIQRIWPNWRREQIIRKIREQAQRRFMDRDYLYVWFLAQQGTTDLTGLVTIKKRLIAVSQRRRLPIYMETTEERLVQIYRRIGFQFYQQLDEKSTHLKIWFGRYQPTL